MQLYLIRHTSVNVPTGFCYGQTDVAVASTFEEEKNNVLNEIKGVRFDKIYSSPLSRCKILAEAITEKQQEIIYDDRLKELDFGDWEGQNWNEIEKTREAKEWFKDFVNTPCPNGEAYSDLLNRVQKFINELDKEKSEENIAVVCHGGVIRAFYIILENVSPKDSFKMEVDYGQVDILKL